MAGLPQQILPPTTPLGTVQMGDNAAPVILDNRWWLFLLALLARAPNTSALAGVNSVLYKTINGTTGDVANFSFNDVLGQLAVGATTASTAAFNLGGHPMQQWLPMAQFPPLSVTAAGGTTLTAQQALAGALQRSGPGSGFTDTTPTVNGFTAAPYQNIVGQYAQVLYINKTAFNWTIAPGSNVIFNGNLSGGDYVIPANSQRSFYISITDGGGTQHTNYYG
jgi:hypothetical protein